MGRLFEIDLEGPPYKCKYCPVEFALYKDDKIIKTPFIANQTNIDIEYLYYFPKCFNVEIGPAKMTYTLAFDGEQLFENSMFPVFCIGCGSHVGFYYEGAVDTLKYNEGHFYLIRSKIHAPPEGSDNENPGT